MSAAASIVVACSKRRFLLRLVTTGGEDTGSGAGAAHVEQILERLAMVTTDRSGHLGSAASALRRAGSSGGALTVLLGGRGEDADSVGRLRRTFAHCTAITFREGPGLPAGAGIHVVDDEHAFPDVWRVALHRRGRLVTSR